MGASERSSARKLPHFTDEREESEFWDSHDSTDYLDETEPVEAEFVDARPRKRQVCLRLDPDTIEALKAAAARKGLGYQTLVRVWLMERLEQEGHQ